MGTTSEYLIPYPEKTDSVDVPVHLQELAEQVEVALNLAVPTGCIMMWSTNSFEPAGWLMCNGQSVERALYPDLFALIGTLYGSVDSTHFSLPNLKGRVPLGFDAGQGEFDAMGIPVPDPGEKAHVQTVAEMPVHGHGNKTGIQRATTAAAIKVPDNLSGALALSGSGTFRALGDHEHPISNEGGGVAHNNLQPYLVLNFIIKT